MEATEPKTTYYKNYSITEARIVPPFPVTTDHVLFGVDPGTTKMGLAYIWKSVCHIYEIDIERSPDAVNRIILAQVIMSKCLIMFDYAPIMVIEGSSFSGFREVELAEIRASCVLWAVGHGIKPHIVPPLTIRKGVFGSGKTKAEVQWANLPPDAASALACAYYSTKV